MGQVGQEVLVDGQRSVAQSMQEAAQGGADFNTWFRHYPNAIFQIQSRGIDARDLWRSVTNRVAGFVNW